MSETLKTKVFDHCHNYLSVKLANLRSAIKSLQESANEETKSTAGDKYETGRAMAQLEIEKLTSQIGEVNTQLAALNKLKHQMNRDVVLSGSLVVTEVFVYFIAVSVGEIHVDNAKVLAISPMSPVAKLMTGKKTGESFTINQTTQKVISIF
jgi:transcription elongation GreA/GreB family factor